MKFDSKISSIYKLVLEQDTPSVPAPTPDSQTAGNNQPGQEPTNPEDATTPKSDDTDTKKLTPDGEVLLIRLIAKALTVKVKPEDLTELVGLDDINEKNAQEMLKKLIDIIRRYSDVDLSNL